MKDIIRNSYYILLVHFNWTKSENTSVDLTICLPPLLSYFQIILCVIEEKKRIFQGAILNNVFAENCEEKQLDRSKCFSTLLTDCNQYICAWWNRSKDFVFSEIKQNAPKPREQQEQDRCPQGLNTQINLHSNKSFQFFHIESHFT